MALARPSGQRPGLRFQLLGFPVTIDFSFFLIMGLLGLGPSFDLQRLAIWIGIAAISILAHELGHAVTARSYGARPTIDLYAFGGLTSFTTPRPLGRLGSISVSIAGPAAGIVLGVALIFLGRQVDLDSNELADYALRVAIFVNLGWGVLNLLPISPLDGGQIMRELLPGDPSTRARRAAMISVPVAGAVALLALQQGFLFGAMLLGMFAFSNLAQTRQHKAARQVAAAVPDARRLIDAAGRGDRGAVPELTRVARSLRDLESRAELRLAAVERALQMGQWSVASELYRTLRGPTIPAVEGLIDPGGFRPSRGRRRSQVVELSRAPSDADTRVVIAAYLGAGDPGGLGFDLGELATDRLDVLETAQLRTHLAGAYREAAEIGETIARHHPAARSSGNYNAACSWARLGAADRALDRLGDAISAGWRDLAQLERDPDLASIRTHPRFTELRARLTAG